MERAWLLFKRISTEIQLWRKVNKPSVKMNIALNRMSDIVDPWCCWDSIAPSESDVIKLLNVFEEIKVTIGREDIWFRSILSDIVGDYQSYCAILEQERRLRIEIEERMKQEKEEVEPSFIPSSESPKAEEVLVVPHRHECITIADSEEESGISKEAKEEIVKAEDEEVEEEEVEETVKDVSSHSSECVLGTPIVGCTKSKNPPPVRRTIRTKTIVWHCLPPCKKKK